MREAGVRRTLAPAAEVVGTGFNARDAMNKVGQLQPDVMTLDVEMPGMSGIDFLKELLPKRSLPVILVSSLNLRVFDALSAGAVDFVRKPEAGQNDAFIAALTQKVHAAAGANVRRTRAMMESSTTMTRIFLLADHIAMVFLPSQDSPIPSRHRFWNVEGATVW